MKTTKATQTTSTPAEAAPRLPWRATPRAGRYERALMAVFTAREVAEDDAPAIVLESMAHEIDRLTRKIAEDARRVGERFASWAAEVEIGVLSDVTSPFGYSSMHTLMQDEATLKAMRDAFWRMLGASYAGSGQELRAAIEAQAA